MSDIAISFPAWMAPLIIGVVYWPVLLVAAVVLAGLGVVVRGRLRAALFGLAAVAALPCVMLLAMDFVSFIDSIATRRAFARTHETLAAPLQIGGLSLPAGTAVTWADEKHEAIVSMELPGPTPLLGTSLIGKLEDVSGRWWSGTLAADARLDGWPCRAGEVWLSHEGRPMRCWLAADHQAQGLAIPAGSEVALSATGRVSDLLLPPERTMALPSIGAALPGGGSLFLRTDGAIERAYVPEPDALRVGDVALRFEIRWVYPEPVRRSADVSPSAAGLRGDLAAETTIDGVVVPAGSLVFVDLASRVARAVPAR